MLALCETIPAINRTVARGPEWDLAFFLTISAYHLVHDPLPVIIVRPSLALLVRTVEALELSWGLLRLADKGVYLLVQESQLLLHFQYLVGQLLDDLHRRQALFDL